MVAAHGEDELAGERPLPPDGEGEAAGEADALREQPRVVGELGLDHEDALARGEAREQGELDRHQGRTRAREGHPGQAEQVDLQAVAEGDRDDGDAVDEREAGEGDAGGEPEVAHLVREDARQPVQLVHRSLGWLGTGVEGLDEREGPELGDVLGDDQSAVDAEAATEAGEEERRRPADRPVDRAEDEEARVGPVLRVAAEDGQAVGREAAHEHADVAGARAVDDLEQAAGEHEAAEVGGDGQAHEVDRPAADREDVAAVPGDREPVDRGGHPEDRELAVEEQRDLGDPATGLDGVEPDPVDVERAELALDDDPPRAGRVAGPQPDLDVLPGAGVALDRQRGAEDGAVVGAARPDVVHDVVRDAVVAATTGRDAQADELEVRPAADAETGRLGIHMEGDAVELDRPEVEQGSAGVGEAQADPHDREAGHQVEVVDGALEDVDRQAGHDVAGDPRGVDLERDADPGGREVEGLARHEGDVDAERLAPASEGPVGQAEGDRGVDRERERLGVGRGVPGQPLDPGEEEVGAGEGGEELGVDGQVAAGEEDALEHPGGPGRDDAAELGGDDARRDRDRQPEQREGDVLGVGVLVLAGGVAGDAREVGRGGVEVPAALEGLGSDGVEGQADAEQPGEPAAGDAGPDDDLGPQDERARGDGERTAAERDLHPGRGEPQPFDDDAADDVVVAIGDLDVTAELQCGSGPVEDEVDVAPGAEGDPARSPGRRLDRDLGA